ncbi:MAG TPA: ImmA/IrrE family metallo-endopeptidase [Candidatus Cloacimonetes bacterium]|nr:ImmA/IrrE family metallo-endopeptidase [Candidatus Cloacimonadota bacterium]
MKHQKIKFPIELEEIITFLGYDLKTYDLPENMNAFTDMIKRKVWINLNIIPSENMKMYGRYRFTLAHEIAHIVLHEKEYLKTYRKYEMNRNLTELETLVRNPDYEKEADIFAGNLILPRDLLKEEFRKKFGWQKLYFKHNLLFPKGANEHIYRLQKITGVSETALFIALKESFLLRTFQQEKSY